MFLIKLYSKLCTSFLIMSLSLLVITQQAHADTDTYLGFKLGYTNYLPASLSEIPATPNVPAIKAKKADTTAIGGALGVSCQLISFLALRGELEYMYRFTTTRPVTPVNAATDKLDAHTALINAYIDFYVLPFMNIYASGGIGFSVTDHTVSIENQHFNMTDISFAAQAGGGMQFIVLKHLVLDLNVRYLYLGKQKASIDQATYKGTYSGVEAIVGIAYKF